MWYFKATNQDKIDNYTDYSLSSKFEDILNRFKKSLSTTRINDPNRIFGECSNFYLDIGSNVGVQVRKLYEPELYKDAPVLPIFDKYFGAPALRKVNTQLCAIGFEMNPQHTARLRQLETSYRSCRYNVHFYTETAVTAYDGWIEFWTDRDHDNHEWGASTVYQWNSTAPVNVSALNLGRFLQRHVVPYANKIVAKIDIEGQELNVIPSILTSGSLCNIDVIMMEYHERMINGNDVDEYGKVKQSINIIMKRAQCKTLILSLDDETYGVGDQLPFQSCFISEH